jgi:tetratricopeptide (TPR) repeat protein
MPSKRRSQKSDDLSTAVDRVSNAYKRLLAFLDLASGFSLAVAVCGVPSIRKQLTSSAVTDAAQFGVALQIVDISGSYDADFVDAVSKRLSPPELARRLCVMVTGIDPLVYNADDILGRKNDRPLFATRINFDRERMAEHLPFPIVFWMEKEAFRILRRDAPDLSQWISARFDFDDIPESASSGLYSLLVLNAMSTPDSAHLDHVDEDILVQELEKYAKAPDRVAVSRVIILLLTLGQQYFRSGRTAESRKNFRDALMLARASKARAVESAVLNGIGMLDLSEGKIKTAIRRFRAALKPSMEANDKVAADASLNLARAYFADGDRHAAILCLRSLIENQATDSETRVDALIELGALHAAAGEKEKAIDAFEEALASTSEKKDPRRSASVMMQIGKSLRKTDPSKAIGYLDRCLKIVARIGDLRSEAHCLVEIGWAYEQMEEYRRAISYFERSRAVLQQLDDKDAQDSVLPSLLYVLGRVGEFDRAEMIARDSLERSRKARNRRNEAVFLLALSYIAHGKGDTQQALETAGAAVEILREIGDPLLENARKQLKWVKGEFPSSTPAPGRGRAGPSVARLSSISRSD